ncbi:MAG: SDR family oxidoreductase [Steroidobacteraceae bacterium]|jgi:uncharacterized protein YbjT (DUF2867 family)|nr:SDR family oxidoreductase [Steroidobacteraceae bacterium]
MKVWLIRIFKWGSAAVLGLIVGTVLATSAPFYAPAPERIARLSSEPVTGRTVLVAGATSASGLELVRTLKERGWRVVAAVRASSATTPLDALGVEKRVFDAMSAGETVAALATERFDAVVSLIGTSARDLPKRRNPIDVRIRGPEKMPLDRRPDYVGNRNLIDAAKAAGVSRFVFVTVIGAGETDGAVPWGARRGHEDVIALKTKAEAHLRDSGLAWTIIRPGGLGRQPAGQSAVLTDDPRAFSFLARSDLARLTADALGDDTTIGKAYTAFDPQRRMIWKLFTAR